MPNAKLTSEPSPSRPRCIPCESPRPSVRRVAAAIEAAEDFGRRCLGEARRLGLGEVTSLTVLGDGAEWIWNIAAGRFPEADQNLDIYHATEYRELARAGLGGDAAAVKEWSKSAQRRLMADGWAGVCEFVNAGLETIKDRAAFESAYPKAANYLVGHRDRMNYAARLRQGRSIGSGLIEGTTKPMLGRRLKQTGSAGRPSTWRRSSSWSPSTADQNGRLTGRPPECQLRMGHPVRAAALSPGRSLV